MMPGRVGKPIGTMDRGPALREALRLAFAHATRRARDLAAVSAESREDARALCDRANELTQCKAGTEPAVASRQLVADRRIGSALTDVGSPSAARRATAAC